MKNGELTFEVFKKSIDNTTLSAKAGQIALKGLAIAGNMIAMWAITKVISVVTEKITELANAAEIAEEKSSGFVNTINNSISSISSNISTLEELNEEYQKLSKGVNALGQNISLSTSEYDRYKNVIQQISEIMPNMATYFNSQGEKIAFAKGNLADLNDEYERYIQQQSMLYVANGDTDGNTIQDVLDDYLNNSNQNSFQRLKSTWKEMWGINDIDDLPAEIMIQALEDIKNKSREEIISYLDDYDISPDGQLLYTDKNKTKNILWNLLGYSRADILNSTDEEFNEIQRKIITNIESLQVGIASDMSKIHTTLIMSAYSKDAFWNIDDKEIRNNITTLLSSINSDVWNQLGIETDNELQVFVSRIISYMSQNTNGFADAWNGLFALNIDEISVDEYTKQVNSFMDTLATALGLDEDGKRQFMVSIGFDDIDTLADNYLTLLNKAAERISGINYSDPFFEPRNVTDEQLSKYHEIYDKIDEFARQYSINTQDEIAAFQKALDEANYDIEKAFEIYLENWSDKNANETPDLPASISQLIDQLNTQLKPAFDSLKSAYQDIFTDDGFNLDAVDIPMLDKIKSEIEELNDLEDVDININMDDFDTFAKILTDVNTTEEQAQQAFDDLATSIFNATGATEGMTEETVQLVEQLLESLGVVNAHEVATSVLAEKELELAESKRYLAETSVDLSNATGSEIALFGAELVAANECGEALALFYLKKALLNDTTISTEADINNILSLASAAGITADALSKLANLKAAFDYATASGNYGTAEAIANQIKTQIQSEIADYKVDVDFSGMKESASKAGSSAGKAAGESFTDILNKELNALDKKMEAGYIDFNDYIQARLALIEDYYRKGKISADEYYSYLEKHYNKQLEIYNKVLNAVKRRYDKEIDSIKDIIDGIEKHNDALEKQLDQYDSVLSVVDKVYEKEINSLKDQQDAIDDSIDALKSANDERERQLALQKAQFELERAQSQRTKLVNICQIL